jgi:hypothetical protein
MNQWDSDAEAHLKRVAADLAAAGVVAVVAEEVRSTWTANLERYEPRELGDTPQLLGLLCSGNIGQRVARRYPGRGAEGADAAVVNASLPDGSLLVRACKVELQVRKAPGESLQPNWSEFSWEESAGVRRHVAARQNSAVYQPSTSDQDGRPPTLDDGGAWPLDDPGALRHVTLVWAGDPRRGLTSGWLGFPCLGSPPWFAVTSLWRDVAGERPDVGRLTTDGGAGDKADSFLDRPAPTLDLRPRLHPRREGSP